MTSPSKPAVKLRPNYFRDELHARLYLDDMPFPCYIQRSGNGYQAYYHNRKSDLSLSDNQKALIKQTLDWLNNGGAVMELTK